MTDNFLIFILNKLNGIGVLCIGGKKDKSGICFIWLSNWFYKIGDLYSHLGILWKLITGLSWTNQDATAKAKAFNHLLHHQIFWKFCRTNWNFVGYIFKVILETFSLGILYFFNFSVFFPWAKFIKKGKLTVLNLTVLPSLSPSVALTVLLSQVSSDPFFWSHSGSHSDFTAASQKEKTGLGVGPGQLGS